MVYLDYCEVGAPPARGACSLSCKPPRKCAFHVYHPCDPLPPPPPPPKDDCDGFVDNKKCKIKIKKCNKNPKSLKKCKKQCNQDAGKTQPLCRKTCCTLGFTV